MLKDENIDKAFRNAAKGKKKKRRKDVAEILRNLDAEKEKLKKEIENETYKPKKLKSTEIHKKETTKKTRRIAKPIYKDQIVHHLIVNQLQPIVTHGLYEHVYGSIPGKGTHAGKKVVEKWIKQYENKKFYILKCDIHHFFESIPTDCLKKKIEKTIRDKRFKKLLYKVLESKYGNKNIGLCLGLYTSPWLANLYLKKLDHFIMQQLKADHYIRYMDDMVVFGRNKKELHKIKAEMEKELEKLGLEFKSDWQVFKFEKANKNGKIAGRHLDFMGFVFHRKRTGIRKSILKRARRKALNISKKRKVSWYDATAMISYLGWFKHTDTYGYYQAYIKPHISVKHLKKLVSHHQKKEKRRKNDKLERNIRRQKTGRIGYNIVT